MELLVVKRVSLKYEEESFTGDAKQGGEVKWSSPMITRQGSEEGMETKGLALLYWMYT